MQHVVQQKRLSDLFLRLVRFGFQHSAVNILLRFLLPVRLHHYLSDLSRHWRFVWNHRWHFSILSRPCPVWIVFFFSAAEDIVIDVDLSHWAKAHLLKFFYCFHRERHRHAPEKSRGVGVVTARCFGDGVRLGRPSGWELLRDRKRNLE